MVLNRVLRYFIYKVVALRRIALSLKHNIHIERGTVIEKGVTLRVQSGGRIFIGRNCYISKGAQLLTHGGDIIIGAHCSVNPYTVIYGQGGVRIGEGTRIAAHCCIVPANHNYSDSSEFIYKQGSTRIGIIIEEDVWLGAGVKVLDGVTIRRGCVIGANAVVTHDTDAYGIYVGVPAKLIKMRKNE